jgi:hypothetical protein
MAAGTPLNFDLSVIAGQPSNAKFNGNTVGDIQGAYQTYVSGAAPAGSRVAGYAQSGIQKYGFANASDWAAAYLQAAGIPILHNNLISATPQGGSTGSISEPTPTSTVTTPDTSSLGGLNDLIGGQFSNLADAFKTAFGTAVYEPPLQSQYYSGTPANIQVPDQSSLAGYTSLPPGATPAGGGFGIGTLLILGAVAVGGYYLYKRYHG